VWECWAASDAKALSFRWCSGVLELNVVVEQSNLFTRLESRQSNVRTAVTAESIAQRTVSTATNLSLDSKVDFGEIGGI